MAKPDSPGQEVLAHPCLFVSPEVGSPGSPRVFCLGPAGTAGAI